MSSAAINKGLPMLFTRFIVTGDSYSEGMTDEIIDGRY